MAAIELIQDLAALDAHLERSVERDVWIFKHSLTCSVSSAALRPFEKFVAGAFDQPEPSFAMVEIQKAREISAKVAERLDIRHESPQVLLVRGGRVHWHASHWSITERALREAG